jgi:hypothetical protein
VIYVYEVFSRMGDQISGLYPTLIIVTVNLHQTSWDDRIKNSSLHFTGSGKREDNTFGSQRGAKIQFDTDTGSTRAIAMGKVKADRTAYRQDEAV